jgi:endo-1,4-beta-xylanase
MVAKDNVARAMKHALTRRSVLKLASLTVAAPAIVMRPHSASSNFNLELAPPLRRHSRVSGIKFGCAGAAPSQQPDGSLLEKCATEANIFSPESSLKWIPTEPQPGQFNFSEGDSIAAFAARQDMSVHGHTLVWHEAIPQWVSQIATAREARAALDRHITALVSRYRGTIWAWDVVNEPIEPEDHLENGYRNSIWFRHLGIDYVDLAFRLARAADPTTPLSLNEWGIEYAPPIYQRRRQAVLALLQKLRERDTPIDCFGLQSHLDAGQALDRGALTDFLRSVTKLGYRLMITELDVNDVNIRGSEAERDIAIARHVTEYLDIVFSVARPMSITTWGLSDRYSWLRQYYKRADGSPLRPLPLDADFNRKRMWASLASYMTA